MHSSLLINAALVASVLAMPQVHWHKQRDVVATETMTSVVIGGTVMVMETVNGAPSPTPQVPNNVDPAVVVVTKVVVISKDSNGNERWVNPNNGKNRQLDQQDEPLTPQAVAAQSPSAQPTSEPTTAVAAAASTAQSQTGSDDYAASVIEQHNNHRRNHSAVDITWNSTLANIAQELASTCVYGHDVTRRGGGYGQNIGAGAPPEDVDAMLTNSMYNSEMEDYPGYSQEPDDSNFEKWGHFSQIVWKSTTSVGCFTQKCTGGLVIDQPNVSPYFTVCNYYPAGNIGGHYMENVGAPRGDKYYAIA